MRIMLVCFVALLLSAGAHAATPSPRFVLHENVRLQHFYGFAYDLKSDKYRYTEVHTRQVQNGRSLGDSIRFFSPEGKLIATQVVDFSAHPFLPLFYVDQRATRHSHGISKVTADNVHVFARNGKQDTPEKKTLPRANDSVAAIALGNFIRAHSAKLLAHNKITISLVTAGNLKQRTFTISRLRDGKLDDHPTVRFKIVKKALTRLLSGQPIILSFDAKTHRLMEYRGPSPLGNPKTHDAYSVRVDYFKRPPPGAPKKLPLLTPGKTRD